MSLAVAVPLGVCSAIVYGASIVVQHRVAQDTADGGDEAGSAGLFRLLRHPVFLLAMGGDAIGFVLQILALSAGSVVVVQPLVVLMLPVALAVGALTKGPRPTRGDLIGCALVLAGLGTFLALIGGATPGRVPRPRVLVLVIALVLVAGAVIAIGATGRNRTVRGAVYGGIAGLYFGTLAVMVDAASDRVSDAGWRALVESPRGFVPILGILVLGGGGILFTQLSFQVGSLSATLPTNLAVDPATGVLLGSLVLAERIPLSPIHIVLYVLCLAATVAGSIRLAGPQAGDHPPPQGGTLTG